MISQKITNDIQNQKPDEITKDDMDMVIMPKFCQISEYYEIPSERCSSEETKIVEDEGITAEKGVRS